MQLYTRIIILYMLFVILGTFTYNSKYSSSICTCSPLMSQRLLVQVQFLGTATMKRPKVTEVQLLYNLTCQPRLSARFHETVSKRNNF